MRTVVVAPDAAPDPVIDVPTLRARLGIASNLNDASLEAFILAATAVLDGPDGWLGRSITAQTLELQTECFAVCNWQWPGSIKLACPPITGIESVTYIDSTGVSIVVDPSTYTLYERILMPAYGQSWPSARYQPDAVRIRYTAGYAAGEVPAPIVQAIVLQVASMNSMTRADATMTSESVAGVYSRSWSPDAGSAYDKAAVALLAPYRVID